MRQTIPWGGLRSKAWHEFLWPDAPRLDAVVVVCDRAAAQRHPVWPGNPIVAHWPGIPDPVAASGTRDDQLATFRVVYQEIERRVMDLAASGLPKLGRASSG